MFVFFQDQLVFVINGMDKQYLLALLPILIRASWLLRLPLTSAP